MNEIYRIKGYQDFSTRDRRLGAVVGKADDEGYIGLKAIRILVPKTGGEGAVVSEAADEGDIQD